MGLFGKKRPLYDFVRTSTVKRPSNWIDKHHREPDALAGVIALMIADGASNLVKSGIPKNHGKVIDADVYAFEVEIFFGHAFHSAFYTGRLQNGPYLREQWANGLAQVSAKADQMCGWSTYEVLKARVQEYSEKDASSMNLFSTLMVVGNATTPMVDYLRPMDIGFYPQLEAGIVAMAGLAKPYAEGLKRVIEGYSLGEVK